MDKNHFMGREWYEEFHERDSDMASHWDEDKEEEEEED
jgi:hypothetical protein